MTITLKLIALVVCVLVTLWLAWPGISLAVRTYRKIMRRIFGASWRTTILGLVAIGIGLWAMRVTYVATNTLWFNVVYVWTGPLGLVFAGWLGLHAKDHSADDKTNPEL